MPVEVILKTVFILGVVVGAFAPVVTWIERKQSAVMQDRIGANRADVAGITVLGLLHPLADVIKLLTKEDVVPYGANRVMHLLAPMIAAVPAIDGLRRHPLRRVYHLRRARSSRSWSPTSTGACSTSSRSARIATYGTVIAGWASNNNWSLLGSVRASAQMISYEVTMGLSGRRHLHGVPARCRCRRCRSPRTQTFRLLGFLETSSAWVDGARPGSTGFACPMWGIFLQPLGFLMFLTCIMAENKRPPFDLPEAESELVAGYFTEYSGMRFGLFYMSSSSRWW